MTSSSQFRTHSIVAALVAAAMLAVAAPVAAGYRTMAPTVVAPAATMPVTWEVNGSSPTPQAYPLADQLGVYVPGAPDESPLSVAFVPAGQRGGIVNMTAPGTQGVFEVRYLPFANGYHATWWFPVMVSQTPFGLDAPSFATGGTPITVAYVVPPGVPAPLGGSLRDQIAIFPVGADDDAMLTTAFVPGGSRTGTVAITSPTTPGTYQIRYQPYANGFRSTVARELKVGPVEAYTLSAPDTVPGDELFTVSFTVPPTAPLPLAFPLQDQIALYAAGAPDEMYLHVAYVPAGVASGTVQLLAPADGGAYEIRYLSFGSGYHADATRAVTVNDSLWGPTVKIQGYKMDENGNPDLVAIVDPTGPGATCGPYPYELVTQSKKSKACGPLVNPIDLRSRVSARGYTALKTRFARGKDVVVSVCMGEGPYECTDHPPKSFCRPKQSTTSAKMSIFVPPIAPAFIDVWFAYVPDATGLSYPACDEGSLPKTLAASAVSGTARGDVNGDGFIVGTDGVLALRCAAGLTVAGDCTRGDLDCSGGTTVTDGVGILRLHAGLPQDVCGTDDPCGNAGVCAGKNCGDTPNFCENRATCGGECPAPLSCGGGGTPNVCGCHRDDAKTCQGRCGGVVEPCTGQTITCNNPGCPCPYNPCANRACGKAYCNGKEYDCGVCPSVCPQPGQEFQNAPCGGTTGKECCGYNCTGIPGINSQFKCNEPCGRENQVCCRSWNGAGQRTGCNPGLSCRSFGPIGPPRCQQ